MKIRGINIKYRINGYHIERKDNLFYILNKKNNNNLKDIKIDSIDNEINNINIKLNNLINLFNQLLLFLQQNQ